MVEVNKSELKLEFEFNSQANILIFYMEFSINILESVNIKTSDPILCRQKEFVFALNSRSNLVSQLTVLRVMIGFPTQYQSFTSFLIGLLRSTFGYNNKFFVSFSFCRIILLSVRRKA